MGKAKIHGNQQSKDEPHKIHGSFEDVLKVSISGNPAPKKKENKKK
jgi:hypothetical protein